MTYTPSCMHMARLQALSILLLASMLVPGPGSAEKAPSGYSTELIHVDANDDFTREELISSPLDRAHPREAMLSATDGTNSPASSRTYSFEAVHSHHEYLMKLKIGTPPETFFAVADTGSDLFWMKHLKLCNRRSSSTFTHVNCSDICPKTPDGPTQCKSCPVGAMCNTCYDGLCMFEKWYGSGTAKGFMGNETLWTTNDKIGVSFGYAIHNDDHLLPESADGIVGLNRGNLSLVQQLNVKKFSYCLSNQSKPELSSQFWFGDLSLSESSFPLNTTRLVQISPEHTSVWTNRYYVELEGISIGENLKYRSIQNDLFQYKSENGKGVMFVDSGCSGTKLESSVFRKLKELLDLELEKSIQETEKNKGHTCFKAAPSKPLVFHFTDKTEMHLPWANYMAQLKDHPDCFRLAIHKSKGHRSVLGNFQQQNIYMSYDLTEGHGNLSFVKVDDCSTLRKYI